MKTGRCVRTTLSLQEANSIAERYEAEGYETKIMKKKQGALTAYEIWIFKEKEGFFGRTVKTD
ncbi:hypothetical protein HYT84_03675 [Candidatus Micrarchaeota archaeon]|nr:hypothetical protein [Candidatus Micrarchaeota archaeon]